ncbi:MAG: hypothetical protein HY459_00465, partial [Parcubacteria group bacterium]|nr:hypothetical protein [Parcubacteria group bacterium]
LNFDPDQNLREAQEKLHEASEKSLEETRGSAQRFDTGLRETYDATFREIFRLAQSNSLSERRLALLQVRAANRQFEIGADDKVGNIASEWQEGYGNAAYQYDRLRNRRNSLGQDEQLQMAQLADELRGALEVAASEVNVLRGEEETIARGIEQLRRMNEEDKQFLETVEDWEKPIIEGRIKEREAKVPTLEEALRARTEERLAREEELKQMTERLEKLRLIGKKQEGQNELA